ncbi:TTAGGG repeat binding factor [Exophiala xenobiotica]|nr:TTAGGG repeat binding factor [Exophiala xenobiotica]
MSPGPLSPRAANDAAGVAASQRPKDEPSSQAPSASTFGTTVAHDDNPRSPKRQRLSPPDDSVEKRIALLSDFVPAAAEPQKKENEQSKMLQSTAAPVPAPPGIQNPIASTQPSKQKPVGMKNRLDSLPLLESIAGEILTFLARLTPSEALGLSNIPNSPKTREYAALRARFDPIRRMFYTGQPFLSTQDLQLRDMNQIESIRKANQATFMSSIFTGEIGLRDMDRGFLPVLVPENGSLLKAQASMFLELKTQGFITAWRTGAAPPHVVMADMFGPDLDKQILARRPGTTILGPTEQDFLNQLSSRREILQTHAKSNTLDQLPVKYRWEDFSREVVSYLKQSIEMSSNNGNAQADLKRSDPTKNLQRGQMEGQFSLHAPPPLASSTESILMQVTQGQTPTLTLFDDDFIVQAARAAEIALQEIGGVSAPEQAPTVPSPTPKQETSAASSTLPEQQQHDPRMENTMSKSPSATNGNSDIPHASQTAPTLILYERARQAATAKASMIPRKGVVLAQRRPWTTEEEHALINGIDQVKGGHWSQILAMYGPGGSISEALKERNQVQLKDKARNLKLFFLKSGIEVPYYLQAVTGDLRTRAPGQASKLEEAKERDRMQLEADEMSFDDLDGFAALEDDEAQLQNMADAGAPSLNQKSPETDGLGQFAQPAESKTTFEPSMADVEAMIARAAAQASQEVNSGRLES